MRIYVLYNLSLGSLAMLMNARTFVSLETAMTSTPVRHSPMLKDCQWIKAQHGKWDLWGKDTQDRQRSAFWTICEQELE